MRADRHPRGSASPAPSRRRPGALTSEPRPRRVRGVGAREGGRARAGGGGIGARTCPGRAGSAGHPGWGGGLGALALPPPGRGAALREGAQPRPPARWRPLRGGRCAAAGPGARRGRISSASRGRRCDSRLRHLRPPSANSPPTASRAGAAQNVARSKAARNGGQSRVGGRARWGWGRGWGSDPRGGTLLSFRWGSQLRALRLPGPVHSGQTRIPRIRPQSDPRA